MNCMSLLGLIMGLLLYGCVSFDVDIGESTQVSGLSNTQFEDEGEKNLAAIRAMLIEEHQRVSVAPDSDNKRSPEPEARPWPPDWLASYFEPQRSSLNKSDLTPAYIPPFLPSLSKRRTVLPDSRAKIPRVMAPPSRGVESDSGPRVPPYTSSAPIESAYPGSSRCVPDMIGGQRCQAD